MTGDRRNGATMTRQGRRVAKVAVGGGAGIGLLMKPAGWPLFAIVLAILVWGLVAVLLGTHVEWSKDRTTSTGTTTTRNRLSFSRDRPAAAGATDEAPKRSDGQFGNRTTVEIWQLPR